jgi:hypothetical protein
VVEGVYAFSLDINHHCVKIPLNPLSKKNGLQQDFRGLIVLFLGCYSAGDGIYVNEYYGDYHNFRGLLQSGFGFTSNRGKISWNQKAAVKAQNQIERIKTDILREYRDNPGFSKTLS